MLLGEIIPIVKKLTGSKTESEKYGPIMNSSNVFKVLEYSLMPIPSSIWNLTVDNSASDRKPVAFQLY